MPTDYAIAAAAVFAVNLLPAFGPPTWSVLIFCQLNLDVEPALLVPLGAIAAASGRILLALGARRFRGLLKPERLANLEAAREVLLGDRRRAIAGLALFAISPIPSAQLFVAAGLLRVRLVPLTAAFFCGRLVSYSLYVGGASLAGHSFGDELRRSLGSPLGIALQLLMLAGLVALVRIDWAGVITRRRQSRSAREPRPGRG